MCHLYPIWVRVSRKSLPLWRFPHPKVSPTLLQTLSPAQLSWHILIYSPTREVTQVISGGQSLFWAAFCCLSMAMRTAGVGAHHKPQQTIFCGLCPEGEVRPMALATERGPPSCSAMGVYVCFVCGSNSVKIKAIIPENSSLKEGDSYTDTNVAVYVPGTVPSTRCGLSHWILARTWWSYYYNLHW